MDTSAIIAKLKDHKPSILGREQYREFGVLIPLIETEQGQPHILFEVRSMNMRSQPGDVCFPGGKMDSCDLDECQCAIRETSEELGLEQTAIQDVFPLDYLISETRIVYPFAGIIKQPEQITPNQSEVERVFTVPLSFFLETKPARYKVAYQPMPEKDFPFELIQGGKNYNWNARSREELFYQYNGNVIWGLTALIMSHFVRLIQANDRTQFGE
ncbi:NUDIX hydrolase [Lentibacillus cibarius]|uniref:CoA pyrophosphatase n=1 Tax=Lentibacillus cibarius TaxID=2583219 RepID=A0A5S3QHD2_9BACI|nr:CoA pyrophosphatase [Lentibacillus cibarius]TMN21300.1 CoA pyrophosphatase [Lentibacillus cibarius]